MTAPTLHFVRRAFVILAGIGLMVMAGCSHAVVTKRASSAPTARSSDSLETVREAFKKPAGAHSYRNALQQVNATLGSSEEKPATLTAAQRQLLTKEIGLEDDELAEVSSPTFTALDAHYLDQCFLLRDAVRSFDVTELKPLPRAVNAFAWVVRQVRLQGKDAEPLPPAFVLRRGWGTSLERSFLFLAILHQMGLDGCLITYPAEASGQGISRYWIPGVRIGKEICLFDTRLGMPLPGPAGKGIATLAQVRATKDYFDQFTMDAKDDRHRYDLTPEQAARTEVLLTWSLPALAPRMSYLENKLASWNQKVRLSADPAAVQQSWDEAAREAKLVVRLHNRLGDFTYATPLRVLRHFLPASEGGVDQSQPPRKLLAENELIPWAALDALRDPDGRPMIRVPPYRDALLVRQVQMAFAQLFVQFPLPAPRNLQIQEKNNPTGVGKEPGHNREDVMARFVQALVVPNKGGAMDQPPLHFDLAPKTPRDELLRGRWEEATTRLVEGLDQVRFQKALSGNDPSLATNMRRWVESAVAAQAELQRAREGGEREEAERKLGALWLGQPEAEAAPQKAHSPPWLPFVLGTAADPLGAEATYLLALCKHERAERAQARLEAVSGTRPGAEIKASHDAWETAANWWRTYLTDYPTGPGAAAARLNAARALEALGHREPARDLLNNLADSSSPLEETGRLYRAKQLK